MIVSNAQKFACTPATLRRCVGQAETDRGRRTGLSSAERDWLKELERENLELRRRTTSGEYFFSSDNGEA